MNRTQMHAHRGAAHQAIRAPLTPSQPAIDPAILGGNVVVKPAPVVAFAPKFSVMATEKIQAARRIIYPGEFVLIDPTAVPEAGKTVLIGRRLELWNGQAGVLGVAVAVWSDDLSPRGESRH